MRVISKNPYIGEEALFEVSCSECDSVIEVAPTDIFVDVRRDDEDRDPNDPPLVPTFKCPVCRAQADIKKPVIQKRVLRLWLRDQPA